MKSELGFLMDLFLSDDVPAPIKKLVAKRIRDVEENMTKPHVAINSPSFTIQNAPHQIPSVIAQQSPSMQRIMAQNPDLIPQAVASPVVVAPPETPAAAEALQRRAAIINGTGKSKPLEGKTGPRKF